MKQKQQQRRWGLRDDLTDDRDCCWRPEVEKEVRSKVQGQHWRKNGDPTMMCTGGGRQSIDCCESADRRLLAGWYFSLKFISEITPLLIYFDHYEPNNSVQCPHGDYFITDMINRHVTKNRHGLVTLLFSLHGIPRRRNYMSGHNITSMPYTIYSTYMYYVVYSDTRKVA